MLYDTGDGVPKDLARELALYDRACTLGMPRACYNLAVGLAEGTTLPQDLPRAVALYQKACDTGYPRACVNLGVLYDHGQGVPQDPTRARPLYETACTQDDGLACYNLGTLSENGKGGMAVDLGKALELYRKACALGYEHGCEEAGRLAGR